MKVHNTYETIQPEAPLNVPAVIETTAGKATVPTQFWAASQFSKMKQGKVINGEELKTLQNQYQVQEKRKVKIQHKQVEVRVTHEDALKGRGYLSKKEYEDKVKAENLPQSAAFKTYGRDTLCYQQKTQLLPRSEFVYDPQYQQVDPRMPVPKFEQNLAHLTEQQYEDPEAVKQSLISGNRFGELKKIDYPDYTDGLEQNTSLKGLHDKRMSQFPSTSAAFKSPNRDQYPPPLLQHTANETILDQYDPIQKRTDIGRDKEDSIRKQEEKYRSPYGQMHQKRPDPITGVVPDGAATTMATTKSSPNKISPRRMANQQSNKDQYPYVINQQKMAAATRTTLRTAGGEVRSPLKSQVIGKPRVQTSKEEFRENWYGNQKQVNHLRQYAQRREQLANAAEMQNSVNENEVDDGIGDSDILVNQKEIQYLKKRIGSPWKQWALPEHQEQEVQYTQKKADGFAELQKKREQDTINKNRVQQDELELRQELMEQEEFDKKKQGKSYSPNYKNLRANNIREMDNRQQFNSAPQYNIGRPDLLTENKYLNEDVPRPLDMKLVAKLRHMHVTGNQGYLRTELKDQEAGTFVKEISSEQQKRQEFVQEKVTAFSGYAQKRNVSPERTDRASSPSGYYPTALSPNSRSNAHPVPAPNMKNQDFSRQTTRENAHRERNTVNLMPTETLNPGRYLDKDIEQAENEKQKYLQEVAQAFRYPNGQVVEKGISRQLIDTLANKMQMMTAMTENGEQAVIQCLRENQIVKPLTTVKDLQTDKTKAFIDFGKQFKRGELENCGQRIAVANYNENVVRLRQEKEEHQYKLKNKLVEPQQPMTMQQRQEDYRLALEQEKVTSDKISSNHRQGVVSLAGYGREVLATRAAAEGMTNLTVPLATQMVLDSAGQLKMPSCNQNYFDYKEPINCVEQYKKIHSAEHITTDLGHTYQNTSHKFAAFETKEVNDAPFVIPDLHNHRMILGSFQQQADRDTAGSANKVVQSQIRQVNDHVYKAKYTQVEPRVSGVVDLGKQSFKK